jgi:GT2 family glycosyltransferase
VVICAYTEDRWQQLERSVDSARGQLASDDEVVLVIDHNEALLRRATEKFRNTAVVANQFRRGASGGRNTGTRHAHGDLVVFLDDDAWAEPGWLDHQLRWFADPDVVAVGGSAHPFWEGGRRPDWLPPSFDWVVGCTYEGQPTSATPVRNVWACNMSVRRTVFESAGGFRESIGGVRAGVTQGCEETELCIRLAEHGRIIYEPASSVTHFVPVARQSFSYFRRRCYQEGLSKSLVARAVGHRSATSSEFAYSRAVVARSVSQLWHGVSGWDAAACRQAVVALFGLATTAASYLACRLTVRGLIND